jgi:signal transduction histidine kinase
MLLLMGLGFQPVLEMLQTWLDHLFFREEARLDTFLSRAGARYGIASTPPSLANLLASDVKELLHLEGTAVFLASRGLVTTAKAGEFPVIDDKMDNQPIPELGRTDPVLADDTGLINLGPAHSAESHALSKASVRAIIPFGSGDTIGVLLCRGKLSDLPFNTRDTTFLKALTTQMEIALGRVQAEASADAAQRLTEAVFESMTNAVALVSHEGVVISANRAFEHTFGTAKGRTLGDVGLPALSLEQLSYGPGEIEGSHGVFLATAKKLAGQGNTDSHILVLTDVTELRRLQEVGRRQAALAEIGATVSSINHEISNIISPINHNMQKLLKLDKVEDIKALAQLIDQRLSALESLTRELREYYRDPTITPREILLKNSIEQILMDLADIAGPQWIPPETQGLDVQLRADPQKLRQVLLNLCKNAWESMLSKNEKKWSVTAKQQDGKVLVSVADSGAGIKAELLPHLYEPFFTTKREHGSGLGMAIVKRIVEAHGGEIKVTSQEGIGTTVTLSWPAAQNQPIEIR